MILFEIKNQFFQLSLTEAKVLRRALKKIEDGKRLFLFNDWTKQKMIDRHNAYMAKNNVI